MGSRQDGPRWTRDPVQIEVNIINSIDVQHKKNKFKFNGYRLQHGGHAYDGNIARYLVQPPKLTLKGKVAARQPPPPERKAILWWRAQCIFRGLDGKGTIEQMQDRLKGHEAEALLEELKLLQRDSEVTFKAKNKEAREHRWLHEMTNDQKAHYNLKRFLTEQYAADENSKDVFVMESHEPQAVEAIAKDLGLECKWTEKPPAKGHAWTSADMVVIGQDKAAVVDKIQSYNKETKRIEKEIKIEREEKERRAHAIAQEEERERLAALARCKNWDVTGTWEISCPYLEANWASHNWDTGDLFMEIYCENTKDGPQMFSTFDFGILTGIMRFERQKGDKPVPTTTSKKRKAQVMEEDEDEDENEDEDEDEDEDEFEDDEEEDSGDFILGKIKQPSAKHNTWNYRLRCEETGEGEIQLGSDSTSYSVTFSGPKVRTLKGTIGCEIFHKCEFTGTKVEAGGGRAPDPSHAWSSRSASAYEEARTGRWH